MTPADLPCKRRIGTDATHCWHRLPISLTVNPPISVYRCCFCGIEKREQKFLHDDTFGHGDFLP